MRFFISGTPVILRKHAEDRTTAVFEIMSGAKVYLNAKAIDRLIAKLEAMKKKL